MDETLVGYINTAFSPELQEQIFKSFDIFGKFEFTNVEEDFIGMIMNASYTHSEDLHDNFLILLNEKLDFVIKQHKLKVSDDASIGQKLELCNGLYRIQSLEDYQPLMLTLESMETNEDKTISILSDITNFSEVELMDLIEEVNPIFLVTLKSFIMTKDIDEPIVESDDLVTKAKYFFSLFEQNTIGRNLAAFVLIGQEFNQYLKFISEEIVAGTNQDIALNLLSVMVLSKDGYKNPLILYRQICGDLFTDVNKIAQVEEFLIKFLNQYNEYLKVQDEKNRVS